MAKQTDRKNKSSKKNYSFTGHRIIDNKKYKDENQYSDSNVKDTTEEMRNLLDGDNTNSANFNRLSGLVGSNQMIRGYNDGLSESMHMSQPMNNHMMGTPINQPVNNHMMSMAMNQPMNNQMMGMPMNNQMMGMPTMSQPNLNNIDPSLVNTLVPLNNNNQTNHYPENLLSPTQMAQSMGGLGNLSKLSNSQQPFFNNPGQYMQTTGQFMQNSGQPMGGSNLKNLAALHSIKMI